MTMGWFKKFQNEKNTTKDNEATNEGERGGEGRETRQTNEEWIFHFFLLCVLCVSFCSFWVFVFLSTRMLFICFDNRHKRTHTQSTSIWCGKKLFSLFSVNQIHTRKHTRNGQKKKLNFILVVCRRRCRSVEIPKQEYDYRDSPYICTLYVQFLLARLSARFSQFFGIKINFSFLHILSFFV